MLLVPFAIIGALLFFLRRMSRAEDLAHPPI